MKPAWKHLGILFLLAFLVRLIGLNQSLWLDEAITARTITNLPASVLIQSFSPFDFHPPGHYLFLQAWTQIFGASEIALRLPSVVFSLLAGWFVYLSSKLISNAKTAWWSAAFFLFNPLIVYYSQEARMYSLIVFLIAANFYFLQRLMRVPQKTDWIGFCATIVMSFWSFYAVVFYFGAVGIFLLWKKQWRILAVAMMSGLIALGVVFPLLNAQFENSIITRHLVPNWSSVLGTLSLKNLMLIPVKILSGRLSFEPKWLYFGLAGAWSAALLFGTSVGVKKQSWLGIFLLGPLVLGVLFSLFTPLLQYFRFLYLAIFVSFALAFATQTTKWLRWGVLFGLVGWSLATVAFPQFYREDWKRMAQDLTARPEPVVMMRTSQDPLKYYAPDLSLQFLEDLPAVLAKQQTVIIIPYTADIHGVNYQAQLAAAGYELQEEHGVRGILWEVWKPACTNPESCYN